MMQAQPEKGNLRQLVEVFENERYIPLSGWGKGLLPSDPNVFSSREGKTATRTIAEYEGNLLSAGWDFDGPTSAWTVATDDLNVDEEGWSYSIDFGGFTKEKDESEIERSSVVLFDNDCLEPNSSENAPMDLVTMEALNRANAQLSGVTPPPSPLRESRASLVGSSPAHVYASKGKRDKSLASVVRRRRLTRWMIFHPFLLLSDEYSTATSLSNESVPPPKLTCDHCDYQELDKLSGALLKALTEASLVAHPRYFDELKLNKLKSSMLACLELKQQHSDMVDERLWPKSSGDEEDEEDEEEGKKSKGYSFVATIERLDAFINGCKSSWATISGSIGGDSGTSLQDKKAKRETVVATYYYSYPERRAVAEMIIRGSDRKFLYHCRDRECGATCHFAPRVCPHEGCDQTFSLVHLPEHDEVCVYKPVPCPRGCTQTISRPVRAPRSTPTPTPGGTAVSIDNSSSSSSSSSMKEEGEEDSGDMVSSSGSGTNSDSVVDTREQLCLIPRRDIDMHMATVCILRPVECPYTCLGCIVPGLRAKDLVSHLEKCQISHSLLLVERAKSDQERIRALEAQNKEQQAAIAFLVEADARTEAKLSAAVASLTAANAAKFSAIQKDAKETERSFFHSISSKLADIGKKEQALGREQAAEKERVNNEFKKVGEALKAQRTYSQGEFAKIAQAALERRSKAK